MGSVRFWVLLTLLLAAVTCFSFRNSLAAGWTDTDALADLSFARAPLLDQVLYPLTGGLGGDNANFWRPAATLQYALLYRLFGEDPVPWHAWDLGLHTIASVLAAAVASVATRSRFATVAAGILFCGHPLAVEVVPAIPRNLDLLLGIGFFGALLSVGGPWFWPAVVLAFGAKESAVALLPVLAFWAPRETPWMRLGLFVAAWFVVRFVVLGGLGGYGTGGNIADAFVRAPVELFLSAASPWLNDLPPNPVPALLIGALLWWGRGEKRATSLGLALILAFVLLYGLTGTYSRRLLYVPTLGAILLVVGRPWLLALACVPWLVGSPLPRPDRDWALTGRVAAAYTDARRYSGLAPGATLWLVDRPVRVDRDPRRLRLWGTEQSMNHTIAAYSLQAWLADHVGEFAVRNLTSFSARGEPESAAITREGETWIVRRALDRSIWTTDQFVVEDRGELRIRPAAALVEPAALVVWNPDSVTVIPVTASSAPTEPPAGR